LAAAGNQFDLVLADPPYGEKNINRRSNSLAQQVLDDPQLPLIVAPTGLLVLGHSRRDSLEIPPAWAARKTLKHGDSLMQLLAPCPSGLPKAEDPSAALG